MHNCRQSGLMLRNKGGFPDWPTPRGDVCEIRCTTWIKDQGSEHLARSGLKKAFKELRALGKREILVTNARAASGRVDPVMTRRTLSECCPSIGPHSRHKAVIVPQWSLTIDRHHATRVAKLLLIFHHSHSMRNPWPSSLLHCSMFRDLSNTLDTPNSRSLVLFASSESPIVGAFPPRPRLDIFVNPSQTRLPLSGLCRHPITIRSLNFCHFSSRPP